MVSVYVNYVYTAEALIEIYFDYHEDINLKKILPDTSLLYSVESSYSTVYHQLLYTIHNGKICMCNFEFQYNES